MDLRLFVAVFLLSLNVLFFSAANAEEVAAASEVKTLDQLLLKVQQDHASEKKRYKQREQRFLQDKKSQQQLLSTAKNEFLQAEKISNPLVEITQDQQIEVDALRAELQQQAMALGDIHSIYNEFSADFSARMQDSLVQAQLPQRATALAKLQQKDSQQLPTIGSMRQMWLLIQQEMTEAGKNQWFNAQVVNPDGSTQEQPVLRLGTFSVFSENKLLRYIPETAELLALEKQPAERRIMADIQAHNTPAIHAIVIDPSRGDLIALLGQSPSLYERVLQGREVGFAIIVLAMIGVLMAAYRALYLFLVWIKTQQQLKAVSEPNANNPLGRIFLQVQNLDVSREEDEELLQLTLDEAILKEIPALERGLSLIKLFAAIAPLLGLLGTVIGMIATFQSISLFGSGDPKLMAGGISQALVTTVLGLVAAIPLLLSHNLLLSLSRVLVQILDEQSAGLLAQDKEKKHAVRVNK